MYLIYSTKQDAFDRSEQEGIELGLSYHTDGKGSRYVSSPVETSDGQWALPVEGYVLDDSEVESVQYDVEFPEPEEDV